MFLRVTLEAIQRFCANICNDSLQFGDRLPERAPSGRSSSSFLVFPRLGLQHFFVICRTTSLRIKCYLLIVVNNGQLRDFGSWLNSFCHEVQIEQIANYHSMVHAYLYVSLQDPL